MASPAQPNRRLNSWKEIAVHLQVETRTVMRWEKDRSLPVHRVPGGKRQAVFAFAEELDAWLLGNPLTPEEKSAERGISSGRKRFPAEAWITLGVLAGLITAAATWRIVNGKGFGASKEVVRVSFAGEKLIAWDASGAEVWTQDFPGLVENPGNGIWRQGVERAQMVDLDGDGRREILAVVHRRRSGTVDDPLESELVCLSGAGEILWRWQPAANWKFPQQAYDGPWNIYDLLVAKDKQAATLWVAVNHYRWWPSFVIRLDAQGRAETRFVNSGATYALGLLDGPQGKLLVAGGFNNEQDAGSVAVLDEESAPATSPKGSKLEYHCENCPAGAPLRYLVLPRTELNRATNASLNQTHTIAVQGDVIRFETFEAGKSDAAMAMYAVSADGRSVEPVRFSDDYWRMHRRLEGEGKLRHSVEQCPDRLRPQPIRMWTASRGWAKLWIPAAATPN